MDHQTATWISFTVHGILLESNFSTMTVIPHCSWHNQKHKNCGMKTDRTAEVKGQCWNKWSTFSVPPKHVTETSGMILSLLEFMDPENPSILSFEKRSVTWEAGISKLKARLWATHYDLKWIWIKVFSGHIRFFAYQDQRKELFIQLLLQSYKGLFLFFVKFPAEWFDPTYGILNSFKCIFVQSILIRPVKGPGWAWTWIILTPTLNICRVGPRRAKALGGPAPYHCLKG